MDEWRQISDCLPAWLTVGNGQEGPEREAPAKVTRLRQGGRLPVAVDKAHTRPALRLVSSSRCKSAHDPRREPPRRADFHLVLVGGTDHCSTEEARSACAFSIRR